MLIKINVENKQKPYFEEDICDVYMYINYGRK